MLVRYRSRACLAAAALYSSHTAPTPPRSYTYMSCAGDQPLVVLKTAYRPVQAPSVAAYSSYAIRLVLVSLHESLAHDILVPAYSVSVPAWYQHSLYQYRTCRREGVAR
eukprot:1128400-Rhodomonas_salina.1